MKTTDENKTLTRRFYEEVMNAHNISKIRSFCTNDFIDHHPDPGHDGKGLDDITAMFNEMFTAFPDLHATIEFMVAEGDMVVVYLTVTGTNTGPFSNMPPTNKSVKINGIDIIKIKNGKAIERWGVFQDLSMMTQLGLAGSENPAEVSGMADH
jgi:steroid delta-isomerase-like uncharacterized protein